MTKIKTFETLGDFVSYNKLYDNYFIYYHVIFLLDNWVSINTEVIDVFNIEDEKNNSIICFCVTGNYFIYSDSWTEEMVDVLIKKVNFSRVFNFFFLGQRDLIIRLFDKSNTKYTVQKDRLIYECSEIISSQKSKIGIIQNAQPSDFDELVQMTKDNYIEEYNGKGEKGIDKIQAEVTAGIAEKSLYTLNHNDTICSIVQVINNSENNPMIGNLFTKRDMRNQGYGFSLLYAVTDGLLKNGHERCGLVSDITNSSSNKVFVNVGYKPVYKWIWTFKQ